MCVTCNENTWVVNVTFHITNHKMREKQGECCENNYETILSYG